MPCNDSCRSVAHGKPSLAIDSLRRRGVAVVPDTAEEPCGSAGLDLAGGIGEVLNPLFAAGWGGQPTCMRETPATVQPRFSLVMDEISRPFVFSAPTVRLVGERTSRDVFPTILFGVWLCGFANAFACWFRLWRKARLRDRSRGAADRELTIPAIRSLEKLKQSLRSAGLTDEDVCSTWRADAE
jgi:hypothetical protein